MRGAGDIQLEDHWRAITKPENFRCAKQILTSPMPCARRATVWSKSAGCTRGSMGPQAGGGSARMFVLPNTLNRTEALARVRAWSSATNNDDGWTTPDIAVKILVIVHRMAANRLGFGGIYSALNDKTSDAMKQGMQDGTGWPVRPFLSFALPIIAAVKAGNEFAAINLLREFSPRLAPAALTRQRAVDVLRELHAAVSRLVAMLDEAGTTIGDIALHLCDTGLFKFDERYARVLGFSEMLLTPFRSPRLLMQFRLKDYPRTRQWPSSSIALRKSFCPMNAMSQKAPLCHAARREGSAVRTRHSGDGRRRKRLPNVRLRACLREC